MNGRTHLTIGASIGVLASLYFSPAEQLNALITYTIVGGFSGLAADLDGPSLLTKKITSLSRKLHQCTLLFGIIGLALYGLLWYFDKKPTYLWLGASVIFLLLGLIVQQSNMRDALVSIVGGAVIVYGFSAHWYWLIGLGVFIVIAPWLKHRGFTHTIWVTLIWGIIAYGLEKQIQIQGIAITATVAYLSHLVADMLTPAGVRLLAPIVKKKFKIKL